MPLSRLDTLPLIRAALREDAAARDATSRAVLPGGLRIRAKIIAKSSGILAGGQLAAWTFLEQDPRLYCRLARKDGSPVAKGTVVLTVEGYARSIMSAERTALNLLGHLSGVATLTRRFVDAVGGIPTPILDTRKTLPGLRALEKYAVRVGGGMSHRADLAEAILIKTNHLILLTTATPRMTIAEAIRQSVAEAKRVRSVTFVEIEVTNFSEFTVALQARPDAILLDNWRLSGIQRAVAARHALAHSTSHATLPILEVSGGVSLANVQAIAKTDVDRISIGRLTHSAPALDLALRIG